MENAFFNFKVVQRSLVTLFLLLVFLWVIGFANFLRSIPIQTPGDIVKSDAIIVLTGGSRRLEVGITLFKINLKIQHFGIIVCMEHQLNI